MRVAIIQANLAWEDPQKNRGYFESKISELAGNADLVVLPEMFTTGFTMNATALAEPADGETHQWLEECSKKYNIAITGSVITTESGKFYNRLFFITPSGQSLKYDKRHLFSYAGEDKIFTSGRHKLIVEYMGWRICPLICYDLRFPVFSRNVESYDLLIYVANWPEVRITAWDTLLKARAIENMSYVIGVNRIGTDGNGHSYIGHSQVVDYLGRSIISPAEDEQVSIAELHKQELDEARGKLRFLDDKDNFILK